MALPLLPRPQAGSREQGAGCRVHANVRIQGIYIKMSSLESIQGAWGSFKLFCYPVEVKLNLSNYMVT